MTDSLPTAKVYDLKRLDGIVHAGVRLSDATVKPDTFRSAEILRLF